MTTPAFLDSIDTQLDWQREVYKDLHRHPEVSLDEHQTADRIALELGDLGLEVIRISATGLVAVIDNGTEPTVLARADIDALPVAEDTGLDFASEVDGVMHACGHDMHAAALLGAVRLLNENRVAWSGTYIALFQPAEENAAGAKAMIDDGLTSKVPTPDVALAQHVMPLPAGTIYTASGPVMSAGDSVKVTVFGRGAHGSMPHLSVDPVVIAASIVLRLQTIVSRETEPGEFAVVTVGASNAGSKSNIIPDRAELLLNVRTYDTAVRKRVIASIERIVRGECEAAGTPKEPTFEYFDQFPLTDNSEIVNDTVTEALTEFFGAEAVQEADPATASEDFSELPNAFGIPYAYWFVGSFDAEKYKAAEEAGTVLTDVPANHSPFFAPELEPTLEIATKAQVVGALAYLG
ncbi:amidohydrolase [Brevibacterium limosum]|uniref:amidohydrolase n=1 Tax=Brevibacterium limosum TaxID=2697565 RepID=UPI001421AA07|nr:amidohydrolase [Brevibacterium limosum]